MKKDVIIAGGLPGCCSSVRSHTCSSVSAVCDAAYGSL